jgi:hypothetical protein
MFTHWHPQPRSRDAKMNESLMRDEGEGNVRIAID